MKFQQIIFALNRIIQVLISLEFTLLNIIPKSLVTLQVLKFLIVQIKAYIQGFQMRYQFFLGVIGIQSATAGFPICRFPYFICSGTQWDI